MAACHSPNTSSKPLVTKSPVPVEHYEENEITKDSSESMQAEQSNQFEETEPCLIQLSGKCLNDRFLAPEGYTKDTYEEESFGAFVRDYSLQEDKALVHLYDGREKGNQSSVAAIFSMPLGDRDLQQCADSVIRMYAEYFYQKEQYDNMRFHFVNGSECSYLKWMEGYRVKFYNDKPTWEKTAKKDNSYETFESYLNMVFSYASTISLDEECEEITFQEVKIGDVFIHSGSPGHVVMVVDVCTNKEGKKAVLLGQGFMPAQEFHVITNPRHSEDPWYYEEELDSPFETADYTFEDSVCKRPQY